MPELFQKKDIRGISLPELSAFFVLHKEKPFRARQVYEWLWKKGAVSFAEMTNLSKEVRTFLENNFTFHVANIESSLTGKDKTVKFAFRLHDDQVVEGVLIPAENRATACISTQAGCPLACRFCATGTMGFKRNLATGEIFDQVVLIKKQALERYRLPLTNIVIMGMGEPLLNYENTLEAIHKITSEEGLEMSPDRITLSTAGIPVMIKKLADDQVKFNLSISLHAAGNEKRDSIMPVNKRYPLETLAESIRYFHSKTKTRVTIEYLLLNNFNDSVNDAKELAKWCRDFPCKINIIEYNASPGSEFSKPDDRKAAEFIAFLQGRNMIVNVRRSRGKDIMAACGQLAGSKQSHTGL